jgi:hypothetical protein
MRAVSRPESSPARGTIGPRSRLTAGFALSRRRRITLSPRLYLRAMARPFFEPEHWKSCFPVVLRGPEENDMPRNLQLLAAGALALGVCFCLPGHGQDSPSPSLGDVARQAQAQKDKDKDKAKPAAKKVFTNDDFASGSGSGSSPTSAGSGHAVQPAAQAGAPGKPAAAAPALGSGSPAEQLGQLGSLLGQLDSLDRATLAKNVLQGNDTDFPGRSQWEDRLFAAKQAFVSQEREIMKKASLLEGSSKGAPDMQNQNDPQLDQLMQEAQQSSAAFQALANEGKQLASQSSGH